MTTDYKAKNTQTEGQVLQDLIPSLDVRKKVSDKNCPNKICVFVLSQTIPFLSARVDSPICVFSIHRKKSITHNQAIITSNKRKITSLHLQMWSPSFSDMQT